MNVLTRSEPLIAAVFAAPERATQVVEQLIERDFPMDRVSLLHRAGGHGDDFLGISYGDEAERIRVWSEHGALWGSLIGLLAGASGLMVVPGIGALLVAGPIVNALTGAAIGAGMMAGSALATRLGIALQRLGIPEETLDHLHQAIMDGKTLLLIHCGNDDPEALKQRLAWQGADPVFIIP
ncbi:MAG: hypothetical protein H6953_08835 [Chromatiaceae bacterium]|nr:hypothetical protein [Chromatiaceae bacterium]MCP5315500.1 hypothetical protein [Chromatiaceae bacterium]